MARLALQGRPLSVAHLALQGRPPSVARLALQGRPLSVARLALQGRPLSSLPLWQFPPLALVLALAPAQGVLMGDQDSLLPFLQSPGQ